MALAEISKVGTSIWLDDLSRERFHQNRQATYLPHLIAEAHVVGVTTNPAIFASAIAGSELYRDEITALAGEGKSVDEIITLLTTSDVRRACDLFAPIFKQSNGIDGRVSIEVDPRLARDTEGTIKQARELWQLVDRANVLVKVPATKEGLPAISTLISEGISVNVTIIFSVSRYQEVLSAFIAGLESRSAEGLPLTGIHSVASFFISRVDTEIDARLKELNQLSHLGRAAVANARLAYEHFDEVLNSARWAALAAQGAAIQRPLWASTGVKDPNYHPAKYVTELVAPHTVNTMPEATLIAVREQGECKGNTITPFFSEARSAINDLAQIGIDMEEVANKLEGEGIDKFIKPWLELMTTVEAVSK
jgi:transaldolase